MKIPPTGKNKPFLILCIMSTLALLTIAWVNCCMNPNKTVGDSALTNQQVLDKGMQCSKQGMAIQLIYDDEWNVWAVKCVEGGFTGSGVKKK